MARLINKLHLSAHTQLDVMIPGIHQVGGGFTNPISDLRPCKCVSGL